ncbi:type I methionyl aminopeptidase [soil metagenome]
MFRNQQAKPPELKSPRELALMRESGRVVVGALKICREMAKPGVRTIEIDMAVEAYYAAQNATPLFKGYPGTVPFPACTCLSINEQVVHGIPGDRVLKEGDILKVDTACKLNGWCADRAISLPIGTLRPERARLIKIAEDVLRIAIEEIPRRKWWSEVASKMQKHAESNGFTVVEDFVGHGIGRTMHENPQVPNYVSRDTRRSDFQFQPGLVLAVEPMVNMGRPDVKTLGDHWTVVTKDGMPSVHVEHTLALTTDNKVMVITAEDEEDVFCVPRVI